MRYELEHLLVNTADFGVPQNRHRAILVAFRDGRSFDWPEATHAGDPVRAGDALRDYKLGSPTRPTGKWGNLLRSIPEGQNYLWHTSRGGGVPLFGYRTKYWSFLLKLARDLPAWTLPASPGPSTGPFHWDNRPLTVEEALRIQSFPRSWKVLGNRTERVRQAGNATPPLLAEVLGRSLQEQLFGAEFRQRPRLSIPRWRGLPDRARPRTVPKEYLHLVGEHEPHAGAGRGPAPILEGESSG